MWDFIGRLKNKATGNSETESNDGDGVPVEDTNSGQLWTHMVKKGCPDCKTNPMQMLEGPSGGMSTNIKCAECGSKFNITPAIGIAERI